MLRTHRPSFHRWPWMRGFFWDPREPTAWWARPQALLGRVPVHLFPLTRESTPRPRARPGPQEGVAVSLLG